MQGAATNSSAELAVQGASAQLQSLVLVGASALAGALAPAGAVPTPDTFSTAIYAAVGAGMSAATESGGRGSEPWSWTASSAGLHKVQIPLMDGYMISYGHNHLKLFNLTVRAGGMPCTACTPAQAITCSLAAAAAAVRSCGATWGTPPGRGAGHGKGD